jgi:two-component system, LytTR family, sensor kinase
MVSSKIRCSVPLQLLKSTNDHFRLPERCLFLLLNTDLRGMNRRIFFHVSFWLAYWLLFAYVYSRYDDHFVKYLISEGFQMPARIGAAYLTLFAFQRGKNRTAFAGAALANVVAGLLNRLIKYVYLVPVYFADSTIDFWGYRLFFDIFDCVLPACMVLSVSMYFKQQALLQKTAALRAEKTAAELYALKSQLQPHFLFNTINNIYALAREKSEKTAPATLKLAHLLRFVLYETRHETIPLEKEVQILKDYIALEKMRFEEDRLRVTAEWQIDNPTFSLSPLLLLPLVENAFKHGANECRDQAFIDVLLKQHGAIMDFSVKNAFSGHLVAENTGIGLQNLRQRLELLYPGRHRLQTEIVGNTFSVVLHIQICS